MFYDGALPQLDHPMALRGLGSPTSQPVYAARYRHLTTRENNKLRPTQAQTVIAAAILRHLHAVITTGRTWDPAIATHGRRASPSPIWFGGGADVLAASQDQGLEGVVAKRLASTYRPGTRGRDW